MSETIPLSAPKFSFEGIKTNARVVKVYDGDSFDIIFLYPSFAATSSVGLSYFQMHCRALGYDSAEIRSIDPINKKNAYDARDFLRSLILDKVFPVEFGKFDKYGRPLIELYVDDKKLSEIMISTGHGVAYFGGTKTIIDN